MQLDLLTVDLLREILRRHGLSTRGTKPELTHRLQTATMPPTTPAASWNLYTEQRLDAFIAALGLDTTGITTKQEKTILLEAVPGLTPNHALTAMMAPTSNKVELQLTKQTATEKPEAFIARAKAHFQLVAPTDTEAVTLLVNAAQPPIAAFITETIHGGTTAKDEILKLVLSKFAPNVFQYYQQFTRFKLSAGQTAQEAGTELRRLFIGFLNMPAAQLTNNEEIIRKTVSARLLDALPLTAATTLRTELLRKPNTTWDELLELADHVLQVQPNTGNTSKAKPHCKIHGYRGHTDAQCSQQQYQGHGKDMSQHPGTPQCFKCYQYGHTARDCPAAKKQGNATTGSG
jgi:hypothetical protein